MNMTSYNEKMYKIRMIYKNQLLNLNILICLLIYLNYFLIILINTIDIYKISIRILIKMINILK